MTYNTQYRESSNSFKGRLPTMVICDIQLTERVCNVALPYEGFHYSGTEPAEINVKDVILQPYIYYIMNSDEEWGEELSKFPGPYAFIDSGNLVHIFPSSFVRDNVCMNDCMHYWRSTVQI